MRENFALLAWAVFIVGSFVTMIFFFALDNTNTGSHNDPNAELLNRLNNTECYTSTYGGCN